MSPVFALEGAQQDGVLAEESRERRKSRNCQSGRQHRQVGPRDLLTEAAHAVHVLFAAHGVNHAARREEEKGLEERMRHQVKNASGERANAAREKHIAQLADSGVRQNFLDIRLHQADRRRKERRGAADDGHDQHRSRRMRKKNV